MPQLRLPRKFRQAPHPVTAFGLILAAAFATVEALFLFDGCPGYNNIKLRLYVIAGDAFMLLSPWWLFTGRWRWVSIVILWIFALFLWANTLYVRYWSDLIPVWLIFDTASYNSFVFNNIVPLCRPLDLFYLITPAAVTWLYRRLRLSTAPPAPLSRRLSGFGLSLLVYALCLVRVGIARHRLIASVDPDNLPPLSESLLHPFIFEESVMGSTFRDGGLLPYVYRTFCLWSDLGAVTLTPAERRELRQFVGSRPRPRQTPQFRDNRGRPLVFIIVESLNSWAVGSRHGGLSVTPVIDSLLTAPGTVAALDVVTQIGDGNSSDGQLIYNTGLHALRSGAASLLFGHNTYPSLARTLAPKRSFELFMEDPAVWNHRATNHAYGYDGLITGHDNDTVSGSFDRRLFTLAYSEIARSPRPYYAELTTLSMHSPFDDPDIDVPARLAADPSLSEPERRYLAALGEFDARLGEFISRLTALPDPPVVVIASDHTQMVGTLDPSLDAGARCVFIALDTGLTMRVTRPVGQIDVYPTILDIMGRLDDARWTGLGHPFTAPGAPAAISQPSRESDLIIRGNFFAPAQ